MDWLDSQPPGRRRLYSLFLALILLTLPCYAAGLFLLAFGTPPAPENPAPAMTEEAPLTPSPTASPTYELPPPVTVPSAPVRPTEEEPEPVATPIVEVSPSPSVLAVTVTPPPLPPT